MAGEVAKAYVSIIPSFRGGKNTIASELDGPVRQGSRTAGDRAGGSFREGFLGRMRGMASAIVPAIGVAAVANYMRGAVMSAAELEQAVGGVDAVFGASAAQIHDWAKTADQSLGLSKTAYSNLATILGSQLKNMGVPLETLNGQTQTLIGLGADLAATYGGSTADAVSAVSALLRGEQDPIERFGVRIMEADVKARMAADGLANLEGEAAKNARTQTVLAMLMEQTAAAQGQFGREANTTSGKLERQRARFENLKATVGEQLIPVFGDVLEIVSTRLLPMFERLTGWVSENRWSLGVLAAVIGGTLVAAMVAWTASVWASTIALLANPVTWVIIGIVALVAAIVLLVKNWDKVAPALSRGMAALRRVGAQVVAWAAGVKDGAVQKFRELVAWFQGLPGQVTGAISGLGTQMWQAGVNALQGFWNGIQSGWSSMLAWLQNDFAGGVIGTVTTALGIHSPSRVFMDIGENVGAGMDLGLARSAGNVLGTMSNLADDVSNAGLSGSRVSLAGIRSGSDDSRTRGGGAGTVINTYGVDPNEVAMKVERRQRQRDRRMVTQG